MHAKYLIKIININNFLINGKVKEWEGDQIIWKLI